MTERSVKVVLRAEVAAFKQGFADASASVRKFTADTKANIQQNTDSISRLSTGAAVAGAALTGLAVLAVSKAASFDASMSSVQAATMESADNMGLLRQAAIDAGQATVFSASESAGAIESLAKAGVSTKDILGGGLTGALNLASSGEIAVADAADIAATALTQFKLDGTQTSHVADLLAAGANKAQGGVDDLGMALKQGGLVAHQTGLTIEETTGVLSAFASAGLIGSDAGTSFKSMLQRLTPQSEQARQAMDRYNLSAYDAQGNFIGMTAWAQKLHDGLAGLTVEQRNATLATVFGSDAVRAASVVYDQAGKGISDWISAVDQQGYAATQASIRLNNLKGDVEQLKGSLETALIGMGESAQGSLRQLTQAATGVVNKFSELPPAAQQATLAIAGGGGLALLGVAGLGKLVVSISEVRSAMAALKISASAATTATTLIGGALLLGTNLLLEWGQAAQESKQNTDDFKATLDETTGAITASTKAAAADKVAKSGWVEVYRNLGGNVSDLTGYVLGNADAIARVNKVLDAQPKESFLWWTGDNVGVDSTRKGLNGLAQDLKDSQTQADLERAALNGVGNALDGTKPKVEDTRSALQKLASGTSDATDATSNYTGALKDLIDAQKGVADTALSERDALRGYQQALDDATASLKDNGRTLDISTEKGRANQDALDNIAASAWQVVDAMQANGDSQANMQQSMTDARDSFIQTAVAMGMSRDAATALADELNLIPANVSVAVAVDTMNAQKAIDNFIGRNNSRSILLDVGGTVAHAGQYVARAGGGILPGAPSAIDNMFIAAATGEYVVNARATAANRPLLDAINYGGGYADGGYVQPGRYVAAPLGFGSGAAGTAGGGTNLTVGQIVAADPKEAIREFRAELDYAAAGVPSR